jgi:hypothetical protein
MALDGRHISQYTMIVKMTIQILELSAGIEPVPRDQEPRAVTTISGGNPEWKLTIFEDHSCMESGCF